MNVDPRPLTLAEFLAWEERQPTKHEFRSGAVFAMGGATDDHGQIITNLIAIIRPVLRGSACRAYANDIKVATDFPGSRYPTIHRLGLDHAEAGLGPRSCPGVEPPKWGRV